MKNKKQKVEIGQCYEENDVIYEVVRKHIKHYRCPGWWYIINVITKEEFAKNESALLKLRRPFNTEG